MTHMISFYAFNVVRTYTYFCKSKAFIDAIHVQSEEGTVIRKKLFSLIDFERCSDGQVVYAPGALYRFEFITEKARLRLKS